MWYFKGRRKKYKSPYTGKEVDAAVARGGNLPVVTSADAGKVLVVDDEGKIIATELGSGLPDVTADDNGKMLQVKNSEWGVVPYPIAENYLYNGTVTLTDAEVPLFNFTPSDYSEMINFHLGFTEIKVNDNDLTFVNGSYEYSADGITYSVYFNPDTFSAMFIAVDSETHVVSGDYSVAVKRSTPVLDTSFSNSVNQILDNKIKTIHIWYDEDAQGYVCAETGQEIESWLAITEDADFDTAITMIPAINMIVITSTGRVRNMWVNLIDRRVRNLSAVSTYYEDNAVYHDWWNVNIQQTIPVITNGSTHGSTS